MARLPAGLKLGVALVVIGGTAAVPEGWTFWFVGVGILHILVIGVGRIPVLYLLKRLALLSPLVLGVAVVNAWQPAARGGPWSLALRGGLCLLTVLLLSNTTPFSRILRVLQWAHLPNLLVTTLALMHRYLFVLAEESDRMRRARASRTFVRGRRAEWGTLSTVVGQLFIRASERAERIYDAMCARGWK
jgi:cobalt/nickel transport system permease protein